MPRAVKRFGVVVETGDAAYKLVLYGCRDVGHIAWWDGGPHIQLRVADIIDEVPF